MSVSTSEPADRVEGDVAVVGASLAGLHAARRLREADHDGRVVVLGAESHRPYDRPPLSKQVLTGEWAPERTDLGGHELDDRIEWRLGTPATGLVAATRELTLADGSTERFAGIVIATGAAPRWLPGCPERGVHVLRTLDDAVALAADLDAAPRRVAVVGGGFIGGEVAASARSRGLEVTIVEVAAVPFGPALGEDLGRVLTDVHRAAGVEVRAGVGVRRVLGAERAEGVELDDGSVVDADVVVLGLGVTPTTDWLSGSGLDVDDGVVCDETLLAAPGVVAAGDVARWPDGGEAGRLEHWDNAVRQGRHAADTLLADLDGQPGEPYSGVPWLWSDQYDVKVQVFGRTRGHEEVKVVTHDPDRGRLVALYRRGDRLVAALGMRATKRLAPYRALLSTGASWEDAVAVAEGPTRTAAGERD